MEWLILEEHQGPSKRLATLDLETGERRVIFEVEQEADLAPALHPGGRWLACTETGAGLRIIDLESGESSLLPISQRADYRVAKAAWAPEGFRMALQVQRGQVLNADVYVYDLRMEGGEVWADVVAGARNPSRLGLLQPAFAGADGQVLCLRSTGPGGAWEVALLELARAGDSAAGIDDESIPSVRQLTLTNGARVNVEAGFVFSPEATQVFYVSEGHGARKLRRQGFGGQPPTEYWRAHPRIDGVRLAPSSEVLVYRAEGSLWRADPFSDLVELVYEGEGRLSLPAFFGGRLVAAEHHGPDARLMGMSHDGGEQAEQWAAEAVEVAWLSAGVGEPPGAFPVAPALWHRPGVPLELPEPEVEEATPEVEPDGAEQEDGSAEEAPEEPVEAPAPEAPESAPEAPEPAPEAPEPAPEAPEPAPEAPDQPGQAQEPIEEPAPDLDEVEVPAPAREAPEAPPPDEVESEVAREPVQEPTPEPDLGPALVPDAAVVAAFQIDEDEPLDVSHFAPPPLALALARAACVCAGAAATGEALGMAPTSPEPALAAGLGLVAAFSGFALQPGRMAIWTLALVSAAAGTAYALARPVPMWPLLVPAAVALLALLPPSTRRG